MPVATNTWAPTIAASNARRIQRFGVSRGVDPARLGAVFASEDPGARVPAHRMFALWEQLAAALDSKLPIQVAQTSSLEDLQLLGFTLTTAPTVREGLSAFLRFCPLLSEAFTWGVSCEGRVVEVRWHCRVPRTPGVRVALECSIAQVVKGMRQLVGDDLDPLRVSIAHPAPSAAAAHAGFFRCPIEFDGSGDRVLFPRHVLEAVPRQANRALWTHLCAEADQALSALTPQPLAVRVRSEISACLVGGRVPRLPELAQRLGTSERSLRRQLADGALSFRKLVDGERRERARALLGRPDMSVTRAALELGFADGSAFAHACRRWFSRPPTGVRS